MKEQRPLQSDLFATPQPLTQLPALQRAKALALLEDLLTQANGATVEQEKAFQQQEVNHDEDPD